MEAMGAVHGRGVHGVRYAKIPRVRSKPLSFLSLMEAFNCQEFDLGSY